MANKTLTLKSEITKPESASYDIIVHGNTSLYLNENVVFSDIDEVPSETVTTTRDIDLTQSNTFAFLLSEDRTGTEIVEQFKIVLSPNGANSYTVSFRAFDALSPTTVASDYLVNKVNNVNFKINDNVLNTLSVDSNEDVPLTHNATISWNGSDSLSFEINYRFNDIEDYQQTHTLNLTIS